MTINETKMTEVLNKSRAFWAMVDFKRACRKMKCDTLCDFNLGRDASKKQDKNRTK